MAFQDKRNNPGNLKFANQPGAIGADEKGFAIFPDQETGMNAMRRQLELDLVERGKTGREFIYKYAPPSDNNPTDAYVKNVFGELGIDPDKKVDPSRLSDIQRLMVRQEHGREGMEHYYSNTSKSPAGTTPDTKSSVAYNAAVPVATAAAVPAAAAAMTVAVPVATRIKTALKKLPIPGDDEQDRAEAERTAQMQAQRDAGIGTLQQYTNQSNMRFADVLNKSRNQRKAEMIAKLNMMRRNPKQKVAESAVGFKDFRKKIYEQIIINEQIEKSKE